jgi:hypothetical protein
MAQAENLQKGAHARGRFREPAVLAAVITAVAGLLGVIITELASDSKPTPVITPAPVSPSFSVAPQPTPGPRNGSSLAPVSPTEPSPPVASQGGVPQLAIGEWRGFQGAAYTTFKLPMALSVKQGEFGESIGSMSFDMGEFFGKCTYDTQLLDSGKDFISFKIIRVKGGDACVSYASAHLEIDETGTGTYFQNSQKAGTLHRTQ